MEVHRNNNEYVKKNLNLLILTPGNENYCNFFSTSLEKCLTKMIHFNDVLQKCLTIMIHFESVFLLRNTDFLRNKDMDKWILKCRNICHRAFIDKKMLGVLSQKLLQAIVALTVVQTLQSLIAFCLVPNQKVQLHAEEKIRHNICLVLKNGYILKIPDSIGRALGILSSIYITHNKF